MFSRIQIVHANREDREALLSLMDALADFEKLQRPAGAARARLIEHGFGEKPKFETWLAKVDGKTVAYAITYETYSTFLALPTFYLEDLFVLPDYRQHKIGATLFLHLVAEANRRGCGRMEWAVLDWNAQAIQFYERFDAQWLSDWKLYRLNREDFKKML